MTTQIAAARQEVSAFYQQYFGHAHTPVLTVPGLNPFELIGLRGRIESTKTIDELVRVLGSVEVPVRDMAASVVADKLVLLSIKH